MRTLLELHYEDVSAERHKRSKTIFGSVAFAHRKKLNQKLILPTRVKEIMRCPRDEVSIPKLELLINAIRREIEGETTIYLTSEDEVEKIARAIETCKSKLFYDEVDQGSRLPKGSRLMVEAQEPTLMKSRQKVAEIIRSLEVGQCLKVKLRPLGTCRQPPLETFTRDLMKTPYKTIRDLLTTHDAIEEVRDKLLLVLWDALFLSASEAWTNDDVSNISARQALEFGWWFEKGQAFSKKPLFEGICAMCGCLLYGVSGRNTLTNVHFGPPINRDGAILVKDGSPETQAQPPFLLRFSPQMLAKEAPEIFEHDPETNGLRLKAGKHEPWIKQESHRTKETTNTWTYCYDCKSRYCADSRSVPKTHLTYRDRASQLNIRPVTRNLTGETQSQPEPEPEHITEEPAIPEEVTLPEEIVPEPVVPEYPTLEEYERKWTDELAKHIKENKGNFDRDNLVPKPIANLFQDCPYVSFDELKSSEAQSRLSVCRPFSAFEHPTFQDGVPRYSSLTGEVNFRRRATRTLASMMGFILNKHDGADMKNLTTPELKALHECQPYLFSHKHHKRIKFCRNVI